jgi:hypothetical protein
MHDCVKTSELLVDFIFDELQPETRLRVLAELKSCQHCRAQYQSMTETLRVFDEVAEVALPDESYWAGYEARLRTRLEQERPSLRQWLVGWFAGFQLLMRPLPVAAGLALFLLALGWWGWQRRQVVAPTPDTPMIVSASPTPSVKPEAPNQSVAVVPKPSENPNKRKPIYPKVVKPKSEATILREEPREEIVAANVDSMRFEQPVAANSLFTPETTRHFEKAQLLLRSFRNVSEGSRRIDLAYEKQLSRRLLYQNILLRREAETRGNLPAEDTLNSLEPFLLDIANLPDKPSPVEVKGIKDRLQRKELIASLQIYSAPPALPTFQNQ